MTNRELEARVRDDDEPPKRYEPSRLSGNDASPDRLCRPGRAGLVGSCSACPADRLRPASDVYHRYSLPYTRRPKS
jgi:hypothetical protein